MDNESHKPLEVDEFVSRQSPNLKCSARELVDLIRIQLGDAEERVEAGIAIFSKDGKDISGVKVSGDALSLLVPQPEIANGFAHTIGNVKVEAEEMRFEKLEDLKRSELKKMIREQGES